jgi:hypothetical protein
MCVDGCHCRDGSLQAAEYLFLELGVSLELVDFKGNTALLLAVWSNHSEIASFLHKQGANHLHPNSKDRTILHYAAYRGDSSMLKTLAGLDLQGLDGTDETILEWFAERPDKTPLLEIQFRHLLRTIEISNQCVAEIHETTSNPDAGDEWVSEDEGLSVDEDAPQDAMESGDEEEEFHDAQG